MIDAEQIIARQLSVSAPEDFAVGDEVTRLTPSRCLPSLHDAGRRLSLDGTWEVVRWPFPVAEEILTDSVRAAVAWQTVEQPGKVIYADADENPTTVPNWNRVTLAHVDAEDGAMLRRSMAIPAGWSGKRILLRCAAIYPAARVYCNGHLLGEHSSGLTPVEWDITELVTAGQQVAIAIRLLRKHPFVQLDMPRHAMEFTGLAQSAWLHAIEPVHLSDTCLAASLSDDLETGHLAGTVTVRNQAETGADCRLTARLCRRHGGELAAEATIKSNLGAGTEQELAIAMDVAAPLLWNDEYPHLYELTVTLEVTGQAPQIWQHATGFRRFELRDERPWLNGQPVKFRGVNHLTYHPEHGMHTPRPWLRQCLLLMKKANVNCIRTHFLGPPDLAELCDELGIYLLQELPIDWGTNFIHNPVWLGPILQRLEGGVRRDRHHPSLMVWSVGNENMPESAAVADAGWHHLHLCDRFVKQLDPTRPTMFPPPGPANKIEGIFEVRVGDIADTHYSFNLARKLAAGGDITNPRDWEANMETCSRAEALARGWSGVWFSSEYGIANLMPDLLNAPYVSIIADEREDLLSGKNTLQVFTDRLAREWGFMRDDPTCLGGAYFPWLCAAAGDNPWGWVRWGEDADWGIVTADLLPKPFFWAMRVLFAPVQFPARVRWQPGEEAISFEVHNLYNQIDLSDCRLRTCQGSSGTYMGLLRDWRETPFPACAPGQRVTVSLPLWNEASRKSLADGGAVVCRCVLLDPAGFRPVTADILVMAEASSTTETAMPIGPDAEL